jgi:hypothetical protein
MYEKSGKNGYIQNAEEYLIKTGDRKDLHLNMTKIIDNERIGCVKHELAQYTVELKIQLSKENLLKTGFYRSVEKKQRRG